MVLSPAIVPNMLLRFKASRASQAALAQPVKVLIIIMLLEEVTDKIVSLKTLINRSDTVLWD